MMRKLKK